MPDSHAGPGAVSGYHAVLLAAGAGTRFGGGKLLAPWRGEALVRHAARIALAAPVDLCVAVTGFDAPGVEAALAGLGGGLRTLRAEAWEEGMAASLRAGVAALPAGSRGVVVFLGDMPLVPRGLAARLLAALEAGAPAAEAVLVGMAPGPAHPVAFGRALYPALLSLRGDRGGRGLLAGIEGVARIPTANRGAATDVDRPEDMPGGDPRSLGVAARGGGDPGPDGPGPRPDRPSA